MDLQPGTRLLATQTYRDDGNPEHLSFNQGDELALLEPKPWRQDWCICRNASGQKGWALIYFLEPQLSEEQLHAEFTRIRGCLTEILQDVSNRGDDLGLIAVSHPKVPGMLRDCEGTVGVLCDFIMDDSDPRRGLDYRHPALEGATRTLALMCDGDDADECRDAALSRKGLIDVLGKRVLNLKNGPIAARSWLESRSADLLSSFSRSQKHFGVLLNEYQTCLKEFITILTDKKNAVHKLDSYHKATHMPAIAGVLMGLASHEKGREWLRSIKAGDTLEAVNAEDESPVANDFCDGIQLLLSGGSNACLAEGQGHVMISYNWAQQTLAVNIKTSLQSLGYQVWLDVEKMEGNIVARMAEAVENSAIVLILYSQKYAQSPNCLMEADYVTLLQRPYIPVFTEPGCEDIKGVLGIMRGRRMFVDFSAGEYEPKIQELQRELGSRGKGGLVKHASKSSVTKSAGPNVLDRLAQVEAELAEVRQEVAELRQQVQGGAPKSGSRKASGQPTQAQLRRASSCALC